MARRGRFLIICRLLVAIELNALGIGVSPGVIRFKNVPLGRKVVATERIVVRNPNPYDSWYRFNLRSEKNHPYFEPLPELNWVTIEAESVFVPAGSVSNGVEVSVTVPNNYDHYNKHYAAAIVVAPGRTGGIGAGVAVVLEIETEPMRVYPASTEYRPFVYPTYVCATELDSFTIYNKGYGVCSYELGFTKSLSVKGDRLASVYERELFFLSPVMDLVLDGKTTKLLYTIFEDSGFITVERKGKEREKGFIRVEKCR